MKSRINLLAARQKEKICLILFSLILCHELNSIAPCAIFQLGQELSAKPFSLLSTNPRFLRTVVLKEDLPAMKDTAGRAGGLLMGRIILTSISQGKHKFRLEYPVVYGKMICMAICKCEYKVEILYFENYGGIKDLQMKWEKHIGTWMGWV